MTYDVNYFIKKFEAIPEEMWCIGTRFDGNNRRCALGWCYLTDWEADKSSEEVYMKSNEEDALWSLFSVLSYPWVAGVNNGLEESPYKQPTPKQRILAALYDIKKQQEPEVKERIVYVTVDAPVRELQKVELLEN